MASRLREAVLRVNLAIARMPAIARLWVRTVGTVSRSLPNVWARAAIFTPLQCAVAAESGLIRFYEPDGHLTNGSMLQEFAASFDRNISVRTSVALTGAALGDLIEDGPVLIKIDAEGAEEQVLRSMESLIVRSRPNILLEVLPQFEKGLNSIAFLKGGSYRFFHLGATGVSEHSCFIASSSDERDYVLLPAGNDAP